MHYTVHALCLVSVCTFAAAQTPPTETGSRPELVLQTGHRFPLRALAFSGDSKLIASTDYIHSSYGVHGDGTIKLWEVSTRRQLRTLVGHNDTVTTLAFSPDGRWLASGSDDDTIRIWDVETGRELQRFYVPYQGVELLYASPDSRYLISLPGSRPHIGRDRTPNPELKTCPNIRDKPGFCDARDLTVWDVQSGRFLFNVAPPPLKEVTDLAVEAEWHTGFSHDGRVLAVAVDGFEVQLWDVASGKQLPTLAGSAPPFVFDSSGRLLATRSANGNIVVWDFPNHREEKILRSAVPRAFSNHDEELITTSGGDPIKVIDVWDSSDGHEVNSLALDPAFASCNRWLTFSPDGRWMVQTGFDETKLVLWDLANLNATPRAWRDLVAPIEFSSDGRWLAAATASKQVWLFDLKTQSESCSQAPALGTVGAVAVKPKPGWLAAASDGKINLWEFGTGTQAGALPGHSGFVDGLVFSMDGTQLISAERNPGMTEMGISCFPAGEGNVWQEPACGSSESSEEFSGALADGEGGIWNWAAGKLVHKLPNTRAPLSFSADGDLAAATADKAEVHLWNISSGSRIRGFGESAPALQTNQTVRAFALSPDGHWLASVSATDYTTINIRDFRTAHLVSTLTGHTNRVTDLVFNSVNGVLASASWDGTVKLWDPNLSKELFTFRVADKAINKLAFSNDGRQLAAAVSNNVVVVWNVESRTQVHALSGHSNAVHGLTFNQDGSLLFSGSDDGSTRIWDMRSGAELATLVSLKDGRDWLVATPDGLFDGTPFAWKQLNWRFDNNTFHLAPVEAYFNDFFYPGLLHEILEGKHPPPPEGKELAKRDRRRPSVTIDSESLATGSDPNLKIRVEVTENIEKPVNSSEPASGGAQDVRLFRNGVLVKVWRGDAFDRKSGCAPKTPRSARNSKGPRTAVCAATVQIVSGENEFTASAFNHDNLKSDEAKPLIITGNRSLERKGVFYFLAIGIDHYQSAGYDLNFAVADVNDMGKELTARQIQLGNYANAEIVSLTNEQATRNNILMALHRFADGQNIKVPANAALEVRQQVEKIKPIQPEDAIVIYFSGHGTNQANHFYLLPNDFQESKLKSTGVSDTELSEVLERVGAGKLMVVVDACQSGKALGGEQEGRGPMNSKGLAQLAYDKGMYILTASQSYQSAQEVSRTQSGKTIEHGLLTFALLEGLTKGRSDRDGRITEREWMNYAVEQVPSLQTEAMVKRDLGDKNQSGQGRKGTLVVVDGDKEADPKKRNVQRPRVFYRRELEARPLIIAKQ